MNWNTENYNKHPKRTRVISTVVIVAIVLSAFVGTVPAERGSLSINADSTQNVADLINGTHENFWLFGNSREIDLRDKSSK